MSEKKPDPLQADILKKATLYQLIEELVLSEHARFRAKRSKIEPIDAKEVEKP